MRSKATIERVSNFGSALKTVRLAKDITQEKFDAVSNRTYVSALERGLKQPTLSKIDELAGVLEVHPLSLLTLCYLKLPSAASAGSALETVKAELEALLQGLSKP